MATTNLNISVVEKRMLRVAEAAHYTGFAASQFKRECPVVPLSLANGSLLWDKRDLDVWLDGLKAGIESQSRDTIVARL